MELERARNTVISDLEFPRVSLMRKILQVEGIVKKGDNITKLIGDFAVGLSKLGVIKSYLELEKGFRIWNSPFHLVALNVSPDLGRLELRSPFKSPTKPKYVLGVAEDKATTDGLLAGMGVTPEENLERLQAAGTLFQKFNS